MPIRLLFSTQRSGSHFVKSVIENRFDGIIASGEVLEQPLPSANQAPMLQDHSGFPHFWNWYAIEVAAGRISVAPDQRYKGFEAYLEVMTGLVQPRDLVLDIKYNSVRTLSGYWDTEYGSNDFLQFLKRNQIPVLHLVRNNVLKMIISNKVATASGIWHRTTLDAPVESLPKIHLDVKQLLFDIRYSLDVTAAWRGRFFDHFSYEEITYEDFTHEQQLAQAGEQLHAMGRFLGQKPGAPREMAVAYKKTTPDNPAEVVENWDEVVHSLSMTEHGWMVIPALRAAA